jgi:hypothetical protein
MKKARHGGGPHYQQQGGEPMLKEDRPLPDEAQGFIEFLSMTGPGDSPARRLIENQGRAAINSCSSLALFWGSNTLT